MIVKALIRAHCRKINKHFFRTLAAHADEAVLLMGNLLLFAKTADETSLGLIHENLTTIKNQITPAQIKLLWQTLQAKLNTNENLLNEEIQAALQSLEYHFMTTLVFYQHLDAEQLVNYGRKINHYRIALVALTRQHLLRNNLPDPFNDDFSYELLKGASVEQNYVYLGAFLKCCQSFPIAHLISLCENSDQVADLILKDLLNSNCYFEISRQLAHSNVSMRSSISQQLRNLLDNYPLSMAQEDEVRTTLQACQSYAEFAGINLRSRVQREQQALSVVVPDEYINSVLLSIAIPTTLINAPKFLVYSTSMLKLGVALCEGTGIMTAAYGACISAVPITVPVLTLGALFWAAKTVNFPSSTRSENQIEVTTRRLGTYFS